MENLDLRVVRQEKPVIEINFEEMKTNLKEFVQQYSNLVVTDATLPVCKQQQKELAGIRVKIDNYRKEIKKEMSKPIDEFETKCKQLIALVTEAENPLQEGIKVFDDKKREEKRQIALNIVKAIIEQHNLKPKYAEQLSVLDKYTNLTAKASEVREDAEQRAFILLGEQKKEEELLELIQDAIDTVNKTIKRQLNISEFQMLIDRGITTKEIIQQINANADRIREAENPKPIEPVVEEVKQEIKVETFVKEESKPADELWCVDMRITAKASQFALLKQYFLTNGVTYSVSAKSVIQ